MNSSALVRSRKYNKERGQLMSHSRKNSLLFDMRAHSSRQGRQYAMNQFPVRDLHLVWSIWPRTTDTQRELFFQKWLTFGLGQTNWAKIFWGIWAILSQTISTFLALWVPCPRENVQRVPVIRAFWDLEKTVLHEIRISGTVL